MRLVHHARLRDAALDAYIVTAVQALGRPTVVAVSDRVREPVVRVAHALHRLCVRGVITRTWCDGVLYYEVAAGQRRPRVLRLVRS